jgi:hypothetical protein
MKPGDVALAQQIEANLLAFHNIRPLPGIVHPARLECFLHQIIDSIRRIKYVTVIREKEISPLCADALNHCFDPLKAAVWHARQGNMDEALWLVFLAIHFGKNGETGWQLTQDVYCALGNAAYWTWQRTSENPRQFRQWLGVNSEHLRATGKFGNHRKYESLNADRPSGTGAVVASYIEWVGPDHDHLQMIETAKNEVGENPRDLFHYLYRSMNDVARFGRTAKFDYLTMVGKLGFVNIEPGSTYINEATGPLRGAKLLFGNDLNAAITKGDLHNWLVELEAHLGLYFGMQVLEDAICNWQKNPSRYTYFGG